ncbi:hypothetical protein GCM10022224_017430 [Nonomuraea antimicrobica]|uniref:Recombinase n=2 Tax=Nonomuraea antimicrobica TaxID=561173 RepID=A0ABP7BCL8_9ACTN
MPSVVFVILAGISDDEARWAQLDQPPLNERTGRKEWTQGSAKRIVGQKVSHPVTATEKVKAIHDMATDEQVAAPGGHRPVAPPGGRLPGDGR